MLSCALPLRARLLRQPEAMREGKMKKLAFIVLLAAIVVVIKPALAQQNSSLRYPEQPGETSDRLQGETNAILGTGYLLYKMVRPDLPNPRAQSPFDEFDVRRYYIDEQKSQESGQIGLERKE